MICRPLCWTCIFFLLIQLARVQTERVKPPPVIEENSGAATEVAGRLYKKEIKSHYQILYLKQSLLHQGNQWCDISKTVIYDYAFCEVKLGNYIQAMGELGQFDAARNPGNFDQRFYYAKQGIHSWVKAGELQIRSAEVNGLAEFLASFRERWSRLLNEAAGAEAGGILNSILLADKSGMDEKVKELYKLTGIGHLLANICTIF